MSTREDYPAGVPCWVDTSQPDPVDAARFYCGLFGWQAEDAMPPRRWDSLLYGPHRRPGRGRDLLAASRCAAAGGVEYLHPRRVR
ncbi:MAG TPA: hypothetical protein VH520_11050 [Streptosporangiaceae bacterium]